MPGELCVRGLYTYPIKSCAATAHSVVALDSFGLAWDRRWMWVDAAGEFVTQRTLPQLALVQPRVDVEAGVLIVHAPGLPELRLSLSAAPKVQRAVRVWQDQVVADDEGDDAAGWIRRWTSREMRLVRFPDQAVRPVNPRFATRPSVTAFADGYPLLLATEESLADLNARLHRRGVAAVPMSRFRPNVVLAGADRPYAEDDWLALQSDDLQLDIVKPCSRCVMTTTDQITGQIPVRGEPLATLATYRRWDNHVVFAQNVIAHGRGALRVGASVRVRLNGVMNRWGIGAGPAPA